MRQRRQPQSGDGINSDQKSPVWICFNEGGIVILLEDSYRTRSTCGPSRTDLTALNVFNILFETILFLNEALFAQRKRTRLFLFLSIQEAMHLLKHLTAITYQPCLRNISLIDYPQLI